jgi:threonine dehydratase
MRAFGAPLFEHCRDFDEGRDEAARLAAQRNYEMAAPFHRDLVLGVAIHALEFCCGAPALDAVYAPIGPDPVAFDIMRRGAERIVTVTDEEVGAAVRSCFQDAHNLAEGVSPAPLAALQKERARTAGKRAGLVLSGSNVDLALFLRLAGRA